MTKKVFAILLGIALLSTLLTVFQRSPVPPGFNADEAAFGYNAYSLLKTGRDEYGTLLPLRLKSFGDYKMPLYSYLSVPFVALFGLSEVSTRALNILISFLFPYAAYFLAYEIFRSKRVGVVTALFTCVSLGLHIVARHAHEALLAAFLTTLASAFLIRALRGNKLKDILLFLLFTILMLFSYHPGRLFAVTFFLYSAVISFVKKPHRFIIPALTLAVLMLFGFTDLMYSPQRLKNLAFFNNEGFNLKISELQTEGGIRYIYNPFFIGAKEIIQDHLTYFSPQFLIANGDENYRFGYPGMSILTPLEYAFFLIGLYYLFRQKEEGRWLILTLLLTSPLSASLAWSKGSLTRTLFLLVPIMITTAYGSVLLLREIKRKFRLGAIVFGALMFAMFLTFAWDFYLFHYPKRLITIHAWQSGYADVARYIKQNYANTNSFYITRDIGQPYIFALFYLAYPPEKYHRLASLTNADEYGFGQVERFDKFTFEFIDPAKAKPGSIIIGSVDNFKGVMLAKPDTLKTIAINGEPMFQIYEVRK